VQGSGKLSGTPSVATNGTHVLVTFANRESQEEPWQVVAARARVGQLPTNAKPLGSSTRDPAAAAIAPVAAGLPDGSWLVQWTEGSGGSYRVRAQAFAADLEPVGEPLAVSPPNANAGQGVVWVGDEAALSLFVVTGDQGKELWGTPIACQ
jgi:hypothetical protein